MKQILTIIAIVVVVVVVLLVLRLPSNNRSASPTPEIPDGITQEEHESHHTDLPQ